ncbi:MAG TPA: hypothetical protein VI037_09825 [Nitrososphaera sp.]
MAGRKHVYLAAAIAAAVVISGIAVYYPSQQQAAVAQVSSNTTNPVNNSSMTLTPTPFPVDTRQYNLTYGEWTARWWQWAYSTPEDTNPVADITGENCDKGQTGPVWFLAGTFGGLNERNCVIPAGKSILFPVMNAACSKLEYPELQTESELRTCAVSSNDAVTELTVTIDGQSINETQLRSTRVQSPLFDLNLPEGNIISGHQGSTQAVSDGFWVFLSPLAPGAHEIHFRGAIVDYTTASQNNFVTESLYHVTIAE